MLMFGVITVTARFTSGRRNPDRVAQYYFFPGCGTHCIHYNFKTQILWVENP
jgi:hypothetical protein